MGTALGAQRVSTMDASSQRPLWDFEEHVGVAPWFLFITIIAGFALRAFRLDHQSLWTDEIQTALSSTGTLGWVVTQRVVNTNIPPLYYVLVHFFLTLGRG